MNLYRCTMTAAVLLGLTLGSSGVANASTISSSLTYDRLTGTFALSNTSDAGTPALVSISIDLSGATGVVPSVPYLSSDIRFDTDPAGGPALDFTTSSNLGVGSIVYPPSSSTEDQQFALISFTGFDGPLDVLHFNVDLDPYDEPTKYPFAGTLTAMQPSSIARYPRSHAQPDP